MWYNFQRYLSEDEDEEPYSDDDNFNNESLQLVCFHDNQLEDKCPLCAEDYRQQTTEACQLDFKDLKQDGPEEADDKSSKSTAKTIESSNTKDFKVQDKVVAKSEKNEDINDRLSKKEVRFIEVPETTKQESVVSTLFLLNITKYFIVWTRSLI